MNKLGRWLAIFSLLLSAGACRMKDATQTVVEVRPDRTMGDLVTRVQIQAYALRSGSEDVLIRDEPSEPVMWPVRRTFTPSSKSSSHRFRMLLKAFDAANTVVASFMLDADVVEDTTRYILVRLGESCAPSKCQGQACEALVDPVDLGNSRQEAFCGGRSEEPSAAATNRDAGDDEGTLPDTPAASMNAQNGGPASSSTNTGTAATSGTGTQTSGQTAQDAGVTVPPPPPSTDGICHDNPCGAHGYCSLKDDAPKKYVCTCETGYEFDDTATTCVVRDDCRKNKGGCEDLCATLVGTGEAVCSCEGDRWLKGDGKQCGELQPEEVLSRGSGSTQRTRPQVAFDSAGNALVAWTELGDDGKYSLWAARYSAGDHRWEKPSGPFLRDTTSAADLHLALDAGGSGLLVWTATVGSHRQLWSARYRNNAFSLAEIHRIDDASESDVFLPALALDSAGDGLIAWTDFIFPRSTLRVARYSASSNAFSRMTSVLASTRESLVMNTSVAVQSASSGLVAWTDVPVSTPDGGLEVGQSIAFNAQVGMELGNRIGFDNGLLASASPDVAMDSQGRGVGVWLRANPGSSGSYTLLSGVYTSGSGWRSATPQVLADDVSALSAPRVGVGPDGSAFAVWRTLTGTDATAQSQTRGALKVGDGFAVAQDLGFSSDGATWDDIDAMNWTPETTVTQLDQWQPHWDLVVGPNQNGFVVGASFNTSSSPPQRQLWLQRVDGAKEPSRPLRLTAADGVPARPSVPQIAMNPNGDGAVVWDRQVDGHFHVYVSMLQ